MRNTFTQPLLIFFCFMFFLIKFSHWLCLNWKILTTPQYLLHGISDSGFALAGKQTPLLPIWKQCYFLCKSTHSKFCSNKSCKFQASDCSSNRNKSPHPWGWCKEQSKVPHFSFFLVAHKVMFMEGHIPIRPDIRLL